MHKNTDITHTHIHHKHHLNSNTAINDDSPTHTPPPPTYLSHVPHTTLRSLARIFFLTIIQNWHYLYTINNHDTIPYTLISQIQHGQLQTQQWHHPWKALTSPTQNNDTNHTLCWCQSHMTPRTHYTDTINTQKWHYLHTVIASPSENEIIHKQHKHHPFKILTPPTYNTTTNFTKNTDTIHSQ